MENTNSPNIEARQTQDVLGKIAETVEEKAKQNLNNNNFGWRGSSTHLIVNKEGEVDAVNTTNKINANANRMSESVVSTTTKATVSETEASHGYGEVSKIHTIYGMGNVAAEAYKVHAADHLYSNKIVTDNYTMAKKTFGDGYRIGSDASGNVFKDYQSNMQSVTSYLSNQNIFVNSMTIRQAETLAKKVGDSNVKFALDEFVRLKKMEPAIEQAARHQGGIINTGKAWISEAIKDSDFNDGLNVARTSYVVGKATLWAGKGAAAGALSAPVKGYELSQKVNVTVNNVRAFHNKTSADGIKIGTQKWKAELRTTRNNIKFQHAEVRMKAGKGYEAVNKAVKSPLKYSTGKVMNSKAVVSLKGKVGGSRIGKAIGTPLSGLKSNYILMQKRLMFRRAQLRQKTAILRILPNAFGKMSLLAKKAVLGVGGALLVLAVVCIILISALGAIIPDGSVQRDDTNSYASGLQNSQVAIDTVYGKYQLAYESNIAFCNPGSEFSLKGLPSTWVLNDATDTVNQEPCAIMGMGAESCNNRGIEGYDLTKYWGAKVCEYTATVKNYTGEYDEYGDPIYSYDTITLIGTAGLEGDAGDYSSLYNFIPESSEAYTNRNAKTNELVDMEIGYRGTQYSEYQYKDNYDPTGYSYFIVGGRYDGELQSYGMGLETGHAVDYSENNMYKAFLGMAHGFTQNEDENPEFYTDYVKKLYHLVADQIEYDRNLFLVTQFIEDSSQTIYFTYTDPDGGGEQDCEASGYKAEVLLLMTYEKTGLQDLMRLEPSASEMNTWAHTGAEHRSTGAYSVLNPSSKDYREWPGWWESDGTPNNEHKIAVDNYEYKEEDWTDGFDTVIFPESRASLLRDFEIQEIILQLLDYADTEGMSQEQIDFIQFALSCVGKYYYLYGGGHGNLDNVEVGSGLDCSGFVSLVLKNSGLLPGSSLTCSGMLNQYPSSSFDGDFSSLKPGSIIVKNSSAGTLSGSSNHVVIYLGYMQLEGDSAPRPYCVESTTAGGTSGVQLSSPGRINTIKNYDYVIDLF